MLIAVDALPITNLSGRHVLLGHLANLAAALGGRHRFVVLHHRGNRDLRRDLGEGVAWQECAGIGTGWVSRLLWQATRMQGLLTRLGADLVISTSGALIPGVRLPQVVLAQNPWCYFPEFHTGPADRLKAALQRLGYRAAQRRALGVFYLSGYVERRYREDAGCRSAHGRVLYVGIDDATFLAARERQDFAERPIEILTVSVMTPHKAIEDVVQVFARVRAAGVPATLTLVGPWSDDGYRLRIEALIARLELVAHVTITGKVTTEQLHAHYGRARVFCLLSRCESFGIPAVEAQCFGTPSVVADVCAPPEVAGPGGFALPPDALDETAERLVGLLTDEPTWRINSERALANAERFRWDRVSAPLIEFLDPVPV
ncbi:glycosyltransferase family 4 protein [Thiocapsa roseopersicina]|uniref:Glycosyltransferase involved in cell wall bisynthesis n=1 Tax=Thiocapsa roseopersicina TaxID=1058 RepID=A0A1H2QBU2_THIRO|nr:glycosyltransferase family 4 protein [Thiocapsa roseopersicina]SDW04631.1 Glycosyltransferase involved in cell wall bisynthesis [Thiocapsa roseopersicina]